jgi:hypothetical protein
MIAKFNTGGNMSSSGIPASGVGANNEKMNTIILVGILAIVGYFAYNYLFKPKDEKKIEE